MKPRINIIACFFAIAICIGSSQKLQAAGMANAMSLGMSGCATSSAHGLDALSINPSLMQLDSSASVALALVNFGLSAGTSALTLSEFRNAVQPSATENYPAAPQLSDHQRDNLLGHVSGGSFAVDAEFQSVALCANITSDWSFGIRQYTSLQMLSTLPQNLVQLVNGTLGSSDVQVRSARVSLLAYSATQLSTSFSLWQSTSPTSSSIRIGISLKRIQGMAYASLDPNSSVAVHSFVPTGWDSTTNSDIAVNLAYHDAGFSKPGSSLPSYASGLGAQNVGWGFDFALSYITKESDFGSTYSVVLSDVGYINWSEAESVGIQGRDTLNSVIGLASNYLDRFPQTSERGVLRTALPARLHAASMWSFSRIWGCNEELQVAAELQYGLNTEGINSKTLRYGFGLELEQQSLRPSVRLGMHAGDYDGLAFSAGCGWRISSHLQVQVAVGNLASIIQPSKAQWLNTAFSWQVRW